LEPESKEEENKLYNETIASNPASAAPEFCSLLAERGPCLGAWPRFSLKNSFMNLILTYCDIIESLC